MVPTGQSHRCTMRLWHTPGLIWPHRLLNSLDLRSLVKRLLIPRIPSGFSFSFLSSYSGYPFFILCDWTFIRHTTAFTTTATLSYTHISLSPNSPWISDNHIAFIPSHLPGCLSLSQGLTSATSPGNWTLLLLCFLSRLLLSLHLFDTETHQVVPVTFSFLLFLCVLFHLHSPPGSILFLDILFLDLYLSPPVLFSHGPRQSQQTCIPLELPWNLQSDPLV